MANEIVIFDAAASNIDGTDPGSPLTVGPGTSYRLREGTEFPGAPLDVLYASSVDTEGELPSSRRYGNRTLTIKIGMIDPTGTLVAALRAKFAKLQQEGGTVKRTLKNGDVRIYDIVAGNGWDANYDWAYWKSDFTEVALTLPAKPHSRGAEVDLGDNVETTLPVLIFTDTGVTGDAPGLGRLVFDNDAGADINMLAWGVQSRYYSSASTAALFYEIETLTAVDGALNAGAAGASGSLANKVIRQTAIGGASLRTSFSTPATAATAWTHIGAFAVWVRVLAPNTNTGTVSMWIEWGPYFSASLVTNDAVALADSSDTPIEAAWCWVNLGLVSPVKASLGNQGWYMQFNCSSGGATDVLDWDCLALVPVDEGYAVVRDTSNGLKTTAGVNATAQINHSSSFFQDAANSWHRVETEGKYLLIPPAGLEARTLRTAVLFAGTRETDLIYLSNATINDVSARLYVTPRYLT